MKNIRQFCAATLLVFSFTFSAFAGDMQFPSLTAAGEISLPGATADPVIEMALSFLLNVSSLF